MSGFQVLGFQVCTHNWLCCALEWVHPANLNLEFHGSLWSRVLWGKFACAKATAFASIRCFLSLSFKKKKNNPQAPTPFQENKPVSPGALELTVSAVWWPCHSQAWLLESTSTNAEKRLKKKCLFICSVHAWAVRVRECVCSRERAHSRSEDKLWKSVFSFHC